MPADIAAALYDFLRADWPIFVAYMATQHGWTERQCREVMARLASSGTTAGAAL
jgi:hypothetical protein